MTRLQIEKALKKIGWKLVKGHIDFIVDHEMKRAGIKVKNDCLEFDLTNNLAGAFPFKGSKIEWLDKGSFSVISTDEKRKGAYLLFMNHDM